MLQIVITIENMQLLYQGQFWTEYKVTNVSVMTGMMNSTAFIAARNTQLRT